MKQLLLFLLLIPITAAAQLKIERSVSYLLAEYEGKWYHTDGYRSQVDITAYKKITGTDTTFRMLLQAEYRDPFPYSVSVNNTNNSANTSYSRKKTPLIQLSAVDVRALVDFHQEIDSYKKSPKNLLDGTTWSISIGNQLEVAVRYAHSEWLHSWKIDQITVEIPDSEVIPVREKVKAICLLLKE